MSMFMYRGPPQLATQNPDFDARKTAPGVVRYFDFDTDYPDGTVTKLNYATTIGTSVPHGTPVRDSVIKCSGVSSLRFDFPSLSGNDAAGSFYANFSANLSKQYGEGDTFYVQWRERWNQAIYDTVLFNLAWTALGTPTVIDATHFSVPGDVTGSFSGINVIRASAGGNVICYAKYVLNSAVFASGVTTITISTIYQGALAGATSVDAGIKQSGMKLMDVIAGDQVGGYPNIFYSSSDAKLVVATYYQNKFMDIYAYGYGGGDDLFFGADKLQNAMPSPFCLFSVATGTVGPVVGCFNYVPNEWMTFQLSLSLGPRGVDPFGHRVWTNTRTRLWGAREGAQSQLLIDFNRTSPGYFNRRAESTPQGSITPIAVKIGQLTMFPHMTGKDPTQIHSLLQVWNDEVIISEAKVDDPGFPSSLTTLASGKVRDLGPYKNTLAGVNGGGSAGDGNEIVDYSGFALDSDNFCLRLFGGGHGGGIDNAIRSFYIPSVTWSSLYTSTIFSEMTNANLDTYPDITTNPSALGVWLAGAGSGPPSYPYPTARHSYNMLCVGNNKLFCMQNRGMPHTTTMQGSDQTAWGGRIWSYDFYSSQFTFSSILHASTPWFVASAACYDGISGKILISGSPAGASGLLFAWLYDPVADVATQIHSGGEVIDQSPEMVYIKSLDKYFLIKDKTGEVWTIALNRATPTSSQVTKLITTGIPNAPLAISSGFTPNGMGYDPVSNKIMGYVENGMISRFDPVTRIWDSVQMINESDGSNATMSQAFHCGEFDPQSGCYIFNSTYPGWVLPSLNGIGHTFAYRP
jgi:hypothetical protein